MGPDAVARSGEWECVECGYVVEGASAQRPVQCPDCGAPAQALEFFSHNDDELVDALYDEDEDDDVLDDDDDERLR